jgi:hypothetical protein
MSVIEEIRTHFQHGVGTRKVKVNGQGRVNMIGSPTGQGEQHTWRFVGMVGDVIRMIDNGKRKAA